MQSVGFETTTNENEPSKTTKVCENYHDDDDNNNHDEPNNRTRSDSSLATFYNANSSRLAEDLSKPARGALNKHDNRNKDEDEEEQFVVHHVTFPKSINPLAEPDSCYTSGENSRCNCSGRRRSTLAGLIELFEQKLVGVRVSQESVKVNQKNRKKNSPEARKVNKRAQGMRDIITPVNYEPEEEDSLEEEERNRCVAGVQRSAVTGVPVLASSGPDLRKLTATHWQPPTDGRQFNHSKRQQVLASCPANERLPIRASRVAATCGPSIVKHQASSSRRLLGQLAKLRKLSEPNYRVRRPEKVAQVEALIEQLERATENWDADELLLERAERRDWPAHYQDRYPRGARTEGDERAGELRTEPDEREVDFGRRAEVHSIEADTIARSHSVLKLAQPADEPQIGFRVAGSWSASSTLKRAGKRNAFADRYHDDLAVRRLTRSPSSCVRLQPNAASEQVAPNWQPPQMSYLLCSNAYTPSIELSDPADLIAHTDDLHFRALRSKPEAREPPFGIPRHALNLHSSASHYLRRQPDSPAPSAGCACTCTCRLRCLEDQNPTRRADSKVSFVKPDSRIDGSASADSGLVVGSPLSGRQSAASRLTPSKSDCYGSETDLAQEVDLDEELRGADPDEPARSASAAESPALERCRAELRATPTRRRSKINIENPRAKSPLLKATPRARDEPDKGQPEVEQQTVRIQCYSDSLKRPTAISQAQYDFHDDDEDEDDIEPIRRRLVTTTRQVSDSISCNDSSSTERLNFRDDKESSNQKSTPFFTIGQYKPRNRPILHS